MKTKRKDAHQRGDAMVEMALVLILLLMLVLGAIEYGWLFLTMQRMTNAARHGARTAAPMGAALGDGDAAMVPLLAPVPTATGSVASTAPNTVTATVTVADSHAVRLINWDLLPVPASLQVSVTMAKEGGN